MAKATNRGGRKPAPRKTRATSRPPRVSAQRKREIFGVLVMAISLLVSLAILTWSHEDDGLIRRIGLSQLFDPSAPKADNVLGLIGAHLAGLLVPNFLGYPVVGLSALLFAWGYVTFRGKGARRMLRYTVLGIVGIFVVSTAVGWFGLALEADLMAWSGSVGLGLSAGLAQGLGKVGSLLVLLALAVVLLLLSVEHDVQHAMDRLEEGGKGLRDRMAEARAVRRELREDRRRREAAEAEADDDDETAIGSDGAHRHEAAKEAGNGRPASSAAPARTSPLPPISRSAPVADPPARTLNDLFRATGAGADPQQEQSPREPARPGPQSPPDAAPGETAAAPTTSEAKPPPVPPSPRRAEPPPDVAFSVHRPAEERRVNLDDRVLDPLSSALPYEFPSADLLQPDDLSAGRVDLEELEEKKRVLLDKLDMHNVQLSNIEAIVGPTVTLFELKPAPGIKISQIKSLESDLAMALAARGTRMIAPIPGKSAVGLEIPNRHRELVRLRGVLATERFRDAKMDLPIIIGKTIQNEVYLTDLTKMPHLLIAGATGSGKSVGLNCLIVTLLYACHPDDLKFVMIDPKKIELQQYSLVQDHFLAMPEDAEEPITTDFAHALGVLKSCIREMEQRYNLLSIAGVRSVQEYNARLKDGRIERSEEHRHLPHIVIIIDELADLMMTAGKEIEGPIARLAQMARAVGLHLVVATQRPSVNVITGLIKANFPSRIAYQVATGIDSRTIIDQYGAEQLVGNGDLLFMSGSRIMRLQSPFVSLDEVEHVTRFIGDQEGGGPYLLPSVEDALAPVEASEGNPEDIDDLFEDAARIIVRSQQGSVSLLQRKLSVGYTRAARIVDQLEDAGIVGPVEGSKARQVLFADDLDLDAFRRSRTAER